MTTSRRSVVQPDDARLAYSVVEAAKLVGLSRRQIYEEFREGRLQSNKAGRRRLIPREELRRWLSSLPRVER